MTKPMPKLSGKFYKSVGGYFYFIQAGGRWWYVGGDDFESIGRWDRAQSAMTRFFTACETQGVQHVRVGTFRALERKTKEFGAKVSTYLEQFPRWEW